MPFPGTAHRVLAAAVTTVALLAMVAAGVVWHAGGADATATAASATPAVEPTTTSSSSSTSSTTTSTSTTSTSTTSTTPTTVKPKPVATTAPVRTTVAREASGVAPPVASTPNPTAPPAPPAGRPAEERCAEARQWVSARGLNLPAGWGFRCPGQALENGNPRWGVACWNCEGNGSWIAVDVARVGASDATLRYVIAHEICHAVDYMTLGISTEVGADLCAALHGAPHP